MAKAQTRAKRKYNEAKYFRVALTIPKNQAVPLKQYAEQQGLTVNKLLNNYITGLLKNTNTSINNDTNISIKDTDSRILENTNTSILNLPQVEPGAKPKKQKPSQETVAEWYRMNEEGFAFQKIAGMSFGNGYSKSAIQRYVVAYKKSIELEENDHA